MKLFPGTGGKIALLALAVVFAAFTQFGPIAKSGGSLLLALTFWAAVIEGCIAAVAAGTLIRARWVASVKKELLSVVPLLLYIPVLFLLLVPFVRTYPWVGQKGIWFHPWFFVARNVAVLLLTYLSARRFALASTGDGEGRERYAALYILAFVVSQSLVAFDWVMSLEYPWVSTLFGGYFFIESLFGGFALSGILYILLYRPPPPAGGPEGRSDLKDLATLLFGFSILWVGLFFAQFLVIWYGNLPEEVRFLVERVTRSPLRELSISVLALFFFLPFLVLLPGKAKTNPFVVGFISLSILAGILVERYVFLAPVVAVNPVAAAINLLALLGLFAYFVVRKVLEGAVPAP